MPTFVPSEFSYQATLNPSARRVAGGVAKATAWTAAGILTFGIAPGVKVASDALKSKDRKYADAIGKAEKFRRNYEKCCDRRKKKKKGCYPDKPGKGLIKTDCRAAYKDWKTWEKKAAKLAEKLEVKLAKKGKLDAKTKEYLALAKERPVLNARTEAQQVSAMRASRGEPPLLPEEAMAYESEALEPEPEGGISPMMVGGIAVGALVVGGGLMWALRR
jgi:hypothetical protein